VCLAPTQRRGLDGHWNLDLVASAFAAAAVDADWTKALNYAVDAVGATGAMLIPLEVSARPGLMFTEGAAKATEKYLNEGWWKRDLRERGRLTGPRSPLRAAKGACFPRPAGITR